MKNAIEGYNKKKKFYEDLISRGKRKITREENLKSALIGKGGMVTQLC